MEMERERIYCIRRSFVSESDSGIETLNLDGMPGSPKQPKMVTGNCRFRWWAYEKERGLILES